MALVLDQISHSSFNQIRTTIVVDPVIAKTVQMRRISRYQDAVYLCGIGFGPRNFCQNVMEPLLSGSGFPLVAPAVTVSVGLDLTDLTSGDLLDPFVELERYFIFQEPITPSSGRLTG